jgi:hypothetical protein
MITAIVRAVPLMVFPLILYASVATTMPQPEVRASLDQIFVAFELPSGALFEVTRGHGITLFGAALLFLEIVKSTSVSRWVLVENVLAFLVFTFAFILFLLQPAFGTIEFALIMGMTLIDFMAGFIVMTVSARRDVSFAG